MMLSFNSCEKVSVKNIDSIGYGTSSGMCTGYCKMVLSIKGERVTFAKSKNGNLPDTKTCTSTLSASEARALKDLVEASKIATLPKTIGCPDCADGGAEWVSVIASW